MLLLKLQELSKQDKLKSSQKNNCHKSYLDLRKRFEKKIHTSPPVQKKSKNYHSKNSDKTNN